MAATSVQQPTYRFFNTGEGWPGLAVEGVGPDAEGRLVLPVVPGLPVGEPSTEPPAGPCVPAATEASGPRGYRYVVDPDGGLLRVLEPATGQTVAEWRPLARPVAVVADERAVYVAEAGSRAVTRFDADGVADAAWWAALSAWAGPVSARALQLVRMDGEQRLVVLADADPDPGDRVLVVRPSGAADERRTSAWNALAVRRRDPRSGRWESVPLTRLSGLAVDAGEDRLYVVAGGILLCFDLDGRWVGRAETPPGWLVGRVYLVPGRCGQRTLTVTGATPDAALTLDPHAGHTRAGSFVCGPVSTGAADAVWRELRARADVPPGCGLRLWTMSAAGAAAPGPQTLPGEVTAPSTLPWTPVPGDPSGALVGSEPARRLWLGGVLTGDGVGTPALAQARVDVATASWLSRLPALYAEPGPSREFLDRALRWLASALRDEEETLDALPARFDPAAAADDRSGAAMTALDQLAGWLGVTLDERWPEARRRRVTAEAHRLHRLRGTAEGLEQLLSLYLDATVTVTDAAAGGSVWVLDDTGTGEPAALGLTTMLAAGAAQGAVVDSTAIPGYATLSDGSDYGAVLYEDMAHGFCVQAYAVDLPDPAQQSMLRALVDAEKPAHLTYHLCLVDATARLGFQSRVGIDAIVAGPPADLVLDGAGELGAGSTLGPALADPVLDPRHRPRAGTAVLGRGLHLT